MGNSEVGHTNIGAGRIVYQELTRITKTIEDGDFFSIPEFTEAIENCKKNNSKLHIMGLLSDGGVHSHIRHLYALLELAKRKDFENVYIHCFLDGRDTPPASGETYIMKLNEKLQEKGIGKIASISGRFYSMDRDKRWERVKKSYDMLVNGIGNKATSAISAIESSYQKEIFDEFGTIGDPNSTKPVAGLHEFKKKFGAEYTEFIGEFTYNVRPVLSFIFTKLVVLYRKPGKLMRHIKVKLQKSR